MLSISVCVSPRDTSSVDPARLVLLYTEREDGCSDSVIFSTEGSFLVEMPCLLEKSVSHSFEMLCPSRAW